MISTSFLFILNIIWYKTDENNPWCLVKDVVDDSYKKGFAHQQGFWLGGLILNLEKKSGHCWDRHYPHTVKLDWKSAFLFRLASPTTTQMELPVRI